MGVNLLDELSIEQWKSLCPSLAVLDVPNKAVVYRQGDGCEHVFWIVSGHVKLSRLTEDGDELTTGFLSKGELFGCLPPGKVGDEAEVTAAAKGATQLYRVSQGDFKNLLSSRPELVWHIIEIMSARQRAAERKLQSILFDDVQHRLVKTLYELSERFGGPCTHGYTIELYFTHQEIADMVGASRPVVSTLLSNFKEQKLLDYSKDAVCFMQEEIFSRYLPA